MLRLQGSASTLTTLFGELKISGEMSTVFTQTTSTSELLRIRKDDNIEGDLTEVQWLRGYGEALVKLYTPLMIQHFIEGSNELVDEAPEMEGLLNYLGPDKIELSTNEDAGEAHKENVEKLAKVDFHRSLVPCNAKQVHPGVGLMELAATCRLFGIKADTDRQVLLERALMQFGKGPMYQAADFDEWIGSESAVRRRKKGEASAYPDFGDKIVERPKRAMTLEEMLAEAEDDVPEPQQKKQKSKALAELQVEKLAVRAERLVKALVASQDPMNVQVAKDFTVNIRELREGVFDTDDFQEHLQQGEVAMQSAWPGLKQVLLADEAAEESLYSKTSQFGGKKQVADLKAVVGASTMAAAAVGVAGAMKKKVTKKEKQSKMEKLLTKILKQQHGSDVDDDSSDDDAIYEGDALLKAQLKHYGTTGMRKAFFSEERSLERARQKVEEELMDMAERDAKLPAEWQSRLKDIRVEWAAARVAELRIEFENSQLKSALPLATSAEEVARVNATLKANLCVLPQFQMTKERKEEARRMMSKTFTSMELQSKPMRWANSLIDAYFLKEAQITCTDKEQMKREKQADREEKRLAQIDAVNNAASMQKIVANGMKEMASAVAGVGSRGSGNDGARGKGAGGRGAEKGAGRGRGAARGLGALLELEDAKVWDQSLAGKLAVRPAHPVVVNAATNKPAYQLDKPLLHKDLQWPFDCALCGKKGHHFSECGGPGLPGIVKRDGKGKEIVTLRQLHKDKFADKFGNKA